MLFMANKMMMMMMMNLDLGKMTLLPYARMFLRRQSITIDSMAVMFLLDY